VFRPLLIDFDECGIALEKCNRSKGHSVIGIRIRKPGHYTQDTKLTVIMAIEARNPNLAPDVGGSVQRPRRWIQIRMIGGTSSIIFSDFCEYVCASIENDVLDAERIFLLDNLRSHLTPLVYQTVEGREGPCTFQIVVDCISATGGL
jgi:hypothetical protein